MSFGKRVDGCGGRRLQPRAAIMFPGSATTISWSRTVLVADLCTTGARLQGSSFPPGGADMLLRIGDLERLATVLWRDGDACGVAFEEPLAPEQVDALRAEARWALGRNLTADERIAVAHWAHASGAA